LLSSAKKKVILFGHRRSGTEANLRPELLVLLQADVYLKFPAPDAATFRGDSKNRKKLEAIRTTM
jgi:hypothetical protein